MMSDSMLWGIAGLIASYVCLPPFLGLIGFCRMSNGIDPFARPGDESQTANNNSRRFVVWSVWIVAGLLLLGVAFSFAFGGDGESSPLQTATAVAMSATAIILCALAMLRRAESGVDLAPTGDDPLTASYIQQLKEMGFTEIGIYWEQATCFGFHWVWRCRERVFVSQAHAAYAALYRFVDSEPTRVAFATCLANQGEVWTGNHSQDEQHLAPDYLRSGMTTNDLQSLLQRHHEIVNRLRDAGHSPIRHGPIELFAETSAYVLHKYGSNDVLSVNAIFCGIATVLVGGGALFAWSMWGINAVPVGILSGVTAKLLFDLSVSTGISQEREAEVGSE